MSSCLSSGAGRTYSFDLDIVKPPSAASSPPSIRSSSSQTSSPSSTLSESSNSPITISTKRPRAPRKRPNQTYDEAAALLATLYPSVFSARSFRKLSKPPRCFDSLSDEPPVLLPAFPAISDTAFLLQHHHQQQSSVEELELQSPKIEVNKLNISSTSSSSLDFYEPGSFEDDGFDAESILDEEVEEGIDSIMAEFTDSSKNSCEDSGGGGGYINPHLGSLVRLGLGSRLEFGFGFGKTANFRRALRRGDDWEWWRSPTVAIRDIVPKFKKLSATEKKKKKTKVEKLDQSSKEKSAAATTVGIPATESTTRASQENLKPNLGLKLDYEDIIKEWSDQQCPYADTPPESPESYARLAQIDLSIEGGNGREASVQRYKEKRRTRLFSKKIRYQVRKVNADRRPRMKASGRFVRISSLLDETIEEEENQ